MNKFLAITFFLLLPFVYANNSFASSELKFSYSYSGPRKSKFNFELYELSKIFEEKNFSRLTSFPSGNMPMINADEVMYSNYHKGTIFIKVDLIAPADKRFKIIAGDNFYLYHTETASIAFFDFTRDEVSELTRELQKTSVTKVKFMSMFLDKAEANDLVTNCQDTPVNVFSGIEMLTGNLSYSLLLKKIGECGVNAMKGVDGGFEKIDSFFDKLKNNPEKLWKEMKESYENLKYLVTHLTAELKKIYESMRFLSIDEMLEIGCTMAGEAVPGMLLMASGVGIVAGTAKIMVTVLPKLQRFQRLMLNLRRVKAPTKGMKEALSCAL
jgi:hypothetical protein